MRRIWLWLAAGLALALYGATLTGVHTYDAYSYAATIQTKPMIETLHPHHLAYGPVGALTFRLAQALGYTGMALGPLQVLNALAGAATVALWLAVLWRLTRSWRGAVLGTALLGLAFAWWRYAVEVEVYTLAALALAAAFGCLLALLDDPAQRRWWLLLAVAHSAAILFHQTNVLWGGVVLVAWLTAAWPAASFLRQRLLLLLLYVGLTAALVGGAYALAMFGWNHFSSWAEVRAWLFEYSEIGFWGGPVTFKTLVNLLRGWRDTLAPGWGWAALLLLGGCVAWNWRALWPRWRAHTLVLLAWLTIYTLFFGWWEADNIEFWIAWLLPLTALVALALTAAPPATRRWQVPLLAGLALALLTSNAWRIVVEGRPAFDDDRRVVTPLAAAGTPADLYVLPNSLQLLYLNYEFNRPNAIELSVDLGNWPRACAEIHAAIDRTVAAGYTVWIDAKVLDPPADTLSRYHLDGAAVRTCMAPFARWPRQMLATPYAVLAPAAERRPAWDWTTGWSEGWRLNFLQPLGWTGGWQLLPGADPHILTPPLRLQAADWRTLEVTMSVTAPDQSATLYWIPPGGGADEQHAVRWPLIGDGQPHTYTLDLSAEPGWIGEIELLRLDPVVDASAGALTLQQLRLLP